MRTTLIAARDVDVRLGVNARTEDEFIGVALSGGSLSLALLEDARGGGTFVGLNAGANSISLEGVPGLTLAAGSLSLALNLGPTTGVLAGLTADFTKGDLDGDGTTTAVKKIAQTPKEVPQVIEKIFQDFKDGK